MTMDVCEVASCMDIMFIYKISRSSTPFIGEKLECQREEELLCCNNRESKQLGILRIKVVDHGSIGSM